MSTYSPRHKNKHPVYFFTVLFILSFLLFLPGFFLFFHQDDFIHMMHSRTLDQVLRSFNLFSQGEFPFYRPIPTQVYFFFLGKLFGLAPLGYHVVNFLIYFINVLLVYRLGRILTERWRVGAIASVIYAINSTHAAPLFSAAYVHELLYVCFGLLTVIHYFLFLKNERSMLPSLIFFVLALMTKENAVILPGIVLLLTIWYFLTTHFFNRRTLQNYLLFPVILALYLVGHFIFYGIASSSSYVPTIGIETMEILIWYVLWALSVPNILIDFLEPGFHIRQVFFSIAGPRATIFLTSFFLMICFLGITGIRAILKAHKKEKVTIVMGLVWFVTAMIPLLPFPLHHLATEQAFALVGLALSIGIIMDTFLSRTRLISLFSYGFIVAYLVHASNAIVLARKTHWIVRSSQQAERVIKSLQTDPPVVIPGKTLVFMDGTISIPEYGSSKQIYEALGNGTAIEIYFGPGIHQLYEFRDTINIGDIPGVPIILDSSQFLGY